MPSIADEVFSYYPGILFVRSGNTAEEQGPSTVANPDEIDIDADYSSDEDEEGDKRNEVGCTLQYWLVKNKILC